MTDQESLYALVIDRQPEDWELFSVVLGGLGLKLIRVGSSEEALPHLTRQDLALILLDVQEPGRSSLELVALARQQFWTQRTPVLLIAGAGQALSDRPNYPLGVVDLLRRPFAPEALKARLAILMEFYRLAQQSKGQAEQLTACRQQLSALHQQIEDKQESLAREREANGHLADLLEATNKELQVLGYSVSHDLRAPLRGIDSFTQALVEDYADKLDAQGREYLERIRANTHRMADLLDALVKLSRLSDAGLYRQSVDLSAMAGAIIADLREREPQRQVTCVIGAGIVAQGDALLLRCVLENLLGNAWKYTSRLPQATIEFGVTRHLGRTAYFVHDDGAGFDMAFVNKLFGAFQRLHPPSEFPGNGIGLATVARIIHRHGGEVWAEGQVGRGATFYFTLP
jgi:signal transduction histidine kinase